MRLCNIGQIKRLLYGDTPSVICQGLMCRRDFGATANRLVKILHKTGHRAALTDQ
jgi:hypothetical protein